MIRYFSFYTLFLMLVFITSCKAQNKPDLAKESIKSETKDTLTSNVWDIKQDRNGNIWFATSDGVFRYDARLDDGVGQGKSFTKITGQLISEPFFSIFEDRKGNFWFGTYGSGVFYYDAHLDDGLGQEKSFQNFTTREGLAHNSVMPVYEDNSGIIWLGTGGGVSRYDARLHDSVAQGKTFRNFTTADGLDNNDVHAIVQDKTGRMWFGSRGNISIYDARVNNEAGQGKTFTTLTDKDGKTFRNVWSMIKDKKGNIWFGAADGLWRYDGSTFTKIDETGAGVIIQDEKGNVLTSIGGPIFRYDEQSLSDKKPRATVIKTKYEGRRNLPFGMLAAKDGTIWIGSEHYNYDGKTLTEFKSGAGR